MSYPVIDRYEIRRGLGRGAMGSVYLAWDPKLGREVAIKILQKEFAQNKKHQQRFEREAKAIAALSHPNVVEIYDYGGSPDDHLYLVMEYVRGPHTGQLCREKGFFPESVLAASGIELAGALERAHRDGIIHRDLKPENVFIDKGRLVLADFGIAKAIHHSSPLGPEAASEATEIIGTPGFMAPEQLEQKPLDERTDIFAFGALLYYLGTRQLPYEADSPYSLLRAFREQQPKPMATLCPQLSDELSQLVEQCLAIDPTNRPSSMTEIRQTLLQIFKQSGAQRPREVLSKFEANPAKYRVQDRHQVIEGLLRRLKVAAQNQEGILADRLRARLAILDPQNSEANRITGLKELLQYTDATPQGLRKHSLHKRWLTGSVTIAAMIIAGTFIIQRQGSHQPEATNTKPVLSVARGVGLLRVEADEATEIVFAGRSIGRTPGFEATAVPTGEALLEFIGPKDRRLLHQLIVHNEDNITLFINWKRGAVLEQAEGKERVRRKRGR